MAHSRKSVVWARSRRRSGSRVAGPAGLCAILILLIMLSLTVNAAAQQPWVRVFESEDDLWEAWHAGEITTEQRDRLLDLFRTGIDSVYQPMSDLAALPGFHPDGDFPEDSSRITSRPWWESISIPDLGAPTVRTGTSQSLRGGAADDRYAVLRWRSPYVSILLHNEWPAKQEIEFRRRTITVRDRSQRFSITAGNFEPRFGQGLIVGRRSRVLGRTVVTVLPGSFLQPRLGRYNGLYARINSTGGVRGDLFVSRIAGDAFGEDILGGQLGGTPLIGLQLGVAFMGARLRSEATGLRCDQWGGSAWWAAEMGTSYLQGEFAIDDHRAVSAAAQYDQPVGTGEFSFLAWTYDPEFDLVSSGGPGHPRSNEMQLLEEELTFRSRTAGEQGLFFRSRMPVHERVRLISELEIINDRLAQSKDIEAQVSVRYAWARQRYCRPYFRFDHRQQPLDNELISKGVEIDKRVA